MAELRPGQSTAWIVTADHGEEFWDHADLEPRLYADPRNDYGVGHGHTLFEELVRIPLILHWPGRIPPGRHAELVSLVDLLPTILEVMQVPCEVPVQGRSLLPALAGSPGPDRPLLLSQPCFGRLKRGVIQGSFKLIESDSEPTLLFDLALDPAEGRDLGPERPAELLGLQRTLARLTEESIALGVAREQGRPPEAPPALDPEQERRLRALGYIQ